MSPVLDQPAVRAYLDELRRLLSGAPDRDLVVEGVARHIEDALADGPVDPNQVQAVLDELGDPAAIAAEAAPAVSAVSVPLLERRGGAILTVLLLTVGGFVVPVLGWVVGVVLLWSSRGWRRVDKIIGTVGIPILLAGAVGVPWLLSVGAEPVSDCTGTGFCAPDTSSFVLPTHLVVIGLLPVLNLALAVFLLIRFRPTRAARGAR